MPSPSFSMPPTRCIKPGVPGIAHGRASVSARAGTARTPASRRRRCGSARWRTARRCPGDRRRRAAATARSRWPENPSDSRITGVRYLTAMRAASIAASKQCTGLIAATTGKRRLARPTEHGDVEVGRLGLGRQAGRRPAALDVDDEHRQLDGDGQRDRLGLQHHARAAGRGDAEVAGEGRTEGHAGGGDLVLGLHGADAEVLVLGQLVEDVRGRRDRVGAEGDGQLGQLTGGDDAPGQRDVARDAGVLARRQRGRAHLEAVADRLGRLAEVVAGHEGRPVGGQHELVARRSAARSRRSSARSVGCTSTTPARGRRSSSSARHRAASTPSGAATSLVSDVIGTRITR